VKTVERLSLYLRHKKISVAAFERSCEIANGYFGKQFRKKGSIGSDILERVAEVYPDLSLNWLIAGKGAMITTPPVTTREDKEANMKVEEEQAAYEVLSHVKKTIKNYESKKKSTGSNS
jgi:hypothetical protein